MTIVYCGNKKVLKGIELSILSILMNSSTSHHFYIFSMDLDFLEEKGIGIHEEDISTLVDISKSYNKDNEITLVDTKEDYYENFYGTKYERPVYTPYSLLRLFMDKHIKEDKALYLDVDTMCYQHIEEFEKIDISDKEVALVKDTLGRFWIHYDYFNSGVLYLNMKKCRENNVFPNSIKYLLSHHLVFADQSALYHVFKSKIYLPRDFNEQRKVRPTTVIKHFCQGIIWFPWRVYNIKQWQVEKLHKVLKLHDFDNVFKKYEELFNTKL